MMQKESIPPMPKHLLEPVQVKAIRSFCLGGDRCVAVGGTAVVPRHVADDLVGSNKAVLL